MPGLLWTLVGVDKASPAFARVAGAADRTAASTLRAQRNTEGAIAGMNRAGSKLTKGLTLPLVAAGVVAVSQAAKFQKATSVYVTAAGESAKNLGVVRDGIKKTAVETGTSIDQLTAAQYLLEKANIRGASSQTLLNAAAKGAIEENANLADVVQGATSVMASYHLNTSKSVQVINALKTGAGSAKTTMEEYVKSLSTVIPVASAAGLSLEQTLGALSTLTQHGTTAQEATQELAFAIRNLQAPNNVAVAAMNQLGIASVDISKNLGKRGLTGTLAYIESKLPRTGLVYLSAMKQMEAGTKDLTIMQSKMSPALAKVSKGFLDGSVSAKDYRADFKGLGADGYAQGTAFLALATKVKGYNDSLKAGTPAQKTMAAELKAIFGGANGLNTALQLGGTNLAGFQQRTAAVGKSLNDTSKDVEGWNRTSKLASVQADRFKETMRVLAINVGTAALPALTTLAHKATDVVTSFNGLSSTQKKVLAWSAGLAVAVGPALAITGKLASLGTGIARFSTFAVSQMARFNNRLALNASGISSAMGKVGGAIGGAAIGVAVGTLTANSNNAVKAIGVLGSAAAGAAIGFGAGGGIGAVIGGLAGGLSALATQFFSAGDSASKQIPKIDGLTQALQADNEAVGKNTEQLVANSLQSSGLYKAGLQLGISQRTLTLASEGNAAALATVHAAQLRVIGTTAAATAAHKNLTKAQGAQVDASAKLSSGLGDVAGQLRTATSAAHNIDAGLGKASGTSKSLAGGLNSMGQAAHNAVNGLAGTGQTAVGASGKIAGLDANAIKALGSLAQLGSPHTVNVDSATAAANLAFIREQIAELPSYKTITITTKTAGGLANTTNSQVPAAGRKATGGTIFGPGTGTSDSVPIMASHGEEVINAKQAGKHRRLLKAINAGVMGFATGGTVGDKHPTYKVGNTKYSTKLGADNARARLDSSKISDTKSALAGLLSVAANFGSSAADISSAARDLIKAAKAQGEGALAQRLASKTLFTLGKRRTMVQDAQLRDSVRNRLGTAPTAATAYDNLATAKQAYSDNYSTARGATSAFDITQLGVGTQVYSDQPAPATTAGTILSALTATANKAKSFAGLLKTLIREGMPQSIVQQLAAAGPAAFDQAKALSAATPAQIKAFRSTVSVLDTAGKTAGQATSDAYYKAGVSSAQGLVNGLLSQEKTLNAAITKLANGMVSTLKHKLKIKSPSQVMFGHGAMTGEGFRLGVESKLENINRTSAKMGGAVQPGSNLGAWRAAGQQAGDGFVKGEHHWHIHGVEDPEEFAKRVERKVVQRAQGFY